MRPASLAVVMAVVGALASTRAEASSCADEERALRAHLASEAHRARVWNTSWAIAFGTAAAAQVAVGLAEWKPFGTFDQDYKETVYVGAAKATIGLAARLVFPLRVEQPASSGDACADLPALRAALDAAARRERQSFWLTHVGGTALNLAGAAFLTYRRSFKVGAISFAISYPVGVLSAYTQPRRSWKEWRARRPHWSIIATTGEATTLGLAGEF
ncbi:MAG: hypothetical protein ACTHU0_28625 [Kofleriaceae bacterium]